MNPLRAGVLLVFAGLVVLAPWRKPGARLPAAGWGLLLEGGALLVTLIVASLVGDLATPTAAGARWGLLMLYAGAYWYAVAGGVGIVRLILATIPVEEASSATSGGITVSRGQLARGRTIGILERAIALTLVLLDQYGALGLIVAAKTLARFRELEDREFAEYFLIGTLASLLHALAVGVGVRILL